MKSETAFAMTGGHVVLDGRPVLRGVDVTIAQGEVVAILGTNGSGKSTLIRALLGLLPLSAGSTLIYGAPPSRFREWWRVGYVPQRLQVGGGVPATVKEVVSSGRVARRRRLSRTSSADRVAIDAALSAVGMSHRAGDPVSTLSGGQQQRVLIARALAGEPDLFVMDEPTAGVDAESQHALAGTLAAQAALGKTIVLVTHELGAVESIITRSIVVKNGVIVHDGDLSVRPGGRHEYAGADLDRSGLDHAGLGGIGLGTGPLGTGT